MLIPSNLKHVTFNRAITNSKKRGWTFVGSTKNHFFCLLTVNDHTVICRPSAGGCPSIAAFGYGQIHFPLAESQ